MGDSVYPPFGRRQEALELEQRVERAFGEDRAGRIDDDTVWAAGDTQSPPQLALPLLFEYLQLDLRVAADESNRRFECFAEPAAR